MAVITIPPDLLPLIAQQSLGQRNFDLQFSSELTGAAQTRLLAPPRWTCGLVGEENLLPEGAAVWRAFVLSLEGRVNQLAVYDILNPEPRGTYRGAPTLTSAVTVGDRTLAITAAGQAGKTWEKGDWIGTGQSGSERQLFSVTADATADGSGAVTLSVWPPAKFAVASGQPVVWDRPTCLMRRVTDETGWAVNGYMSGGFSLDLMESWE